MLTGEGATDLYNNPQYQTNDQDAALRRFTLFEVGCAALGAESWAGGLEAGKLAKRTLTAYLRTVQTSNFRQYGNE